MARKKFLEDLKRAQHNPPAHVSKIERYDGDGVSFNYWYQQGSARREVGLRLLTTNIDEYPDNNQFILFTEDDVDFIVTDAFVQLQAIIDGCSIATALREISGGLHQTLTSGLAENPISLDSSSQAQSDSEPDDFDTQEQFDDDDDDRNFGLEDLQPARPTARSVNRSSSQLGSETSEAIKNDLRAAKEAGFKIGVHGDLSKAGIVCISVMVKKLGISEEAMQAWGLLRRQYLVLLIRFQHGYKSLAKVMELPTLSGLVEMRVGLSDSYKPNVDEAFSAFNQVEESTRPQNAPQLHQKEASIVGVLLPLFIGRPINGLLRDRFSKIIKFRRQFNLSWYGAERLFNDRQGALLSDLSKDMANYYEGAEEVAATSVLRHIVTDDSFSTCQLPEASLPLVAMQFVLRHLVRCTEFCLVCHCRVEATFEALKPYVCSNPLCLYQFIALGFGPAAEWEILSQPYVVDLLVGLCYAQARASRIKEFPLGINLKVPILPHFNTALPSISPHQQVLLGRIAANSPNPKPAHAPAIAFKAKFEVVSKFLSPIPGTWTAGKQCVRKGDWIVLVPTASQHFGVHYCCIIEENGLNFGLEPVICGTTGISNAQTDIKVARLSTLDVDCYLYDATFDELTGQYQNMAIVSLLDTLPTIMEMRKILVQQQSGHRDANLNSLRTHCPQAALDLLRWIIASNRSCIMQVDQVASESGTTQKLKASEDRVSGMDDWMQFRFAQGAPDKEQRFIDSVSSRTSNAHHPTLFAWHGSPLHNWHSIIRQGLNFDEVHHGRANGHGVYMSPYVTTSIGYADMRGVVPSSGWPNSILKISSVVSLQEVVNAPQAFICTNPHFVVAQKDWIQTRYLFVKTSVRHSTGASTKVIYQQDPKYTAYGTKNEVISIPMTAISKSRRPDDISLSFPSSKKRKAVSQDDDSDDGWSVTTTYDDHKLLRDFDDDRDSGDIDMTDVEDLVTDEIDEEYHKSPPNSSRKRNYETGKGYLLDATKTEFVPGALDMTGVRLLDPPGYATSAASKALMRAFNDTIKVQQTTLLHELGFYMDHTRIDNMYQWIVELHSFDKALPLAKDMKMAKIGSIVCEMQFTDQFPFSPPFIRVVKPRFLDPMMGGGGHITNGGAICMELLTSNGWSAVNSIESVLLQVRLAMSEVERPARLLSSRGVYQTVPYPIGEAVEAYRRFCNRHGWQVPKGLDRLR